MTNATSYEVIEVAEYYLAGRMARMEHVLATGLTEARARKVARMHGGTVRASPSTRILGLVRSSRRCDRALVKPEGE